MLLYGSAIEVAERRTAEKSSHGNGWVLALPHLRGNTSDEKVVGCFHSKVGLEGAR